MTQHTFTSGSVEVTVPADEAITLTLTFPGEAQEVIQLTELSADLLALGLAQREDEGSAGSAEDSKQVEMGTLDCGDGISFSVDGESIPAEQALSLLGTGVVLAIQAVTARELA